MLWLTKIWFLFHLHFILIKCDPGSADDLSVHILDKKLMEKKRQDTREMCKLFNSEIVQASLAADATPVNKYDKRKKELQLKGKKELQKTKRIKRAVHSVNPALNVEDEERVETIVDKIYDDLLEKGQKIPYRRKGMRPNAPTVDAQNNSPAANYSGRRYPFAPHQLYGPTTGTPIHPMETDINSKPVRFVNAIVPYFIDSKTYDTHLSEVIMKAFDYIEKATCIRLQRLRERPTDQQSLQNVYWIYISNPSGIRQCVHSNERARVKGVQLIVFGYDCMSLGDVAHEIMHVLGFTHEHMRPDRDQYITILWDNIKPGYRKYFEIQPQFIGDGLPYDYASVLHYPPRAFSKNGQATILTEADIKIGQREGLSEMDVEKIGMVYSNECVKRNREYLLKTCPSVIKAETPKTQVSQQDIEDYFENRLWPYGVVNYKFKTAFEFSKEELENINAVIRHLEKETCVEFRDLTSSTEAVAVEEVSSMEYEFNSSERETLVTLDETGDTEEIVFPVKSIPYKENKTLPNGIIDPLKNDARKGDNRKDTSRGKAKVAKVKNTKIGAKKKVINPGVKVNGSNTEARGKSANVTTGKQPTVRRKRAVPLLQTRRHVNHILVLSRSPEPGCRCPQPGKPESEYELMINTDCFNTVNDLLHLFVHTLGLDHQHNMHDRDSFLHIAWDQLTEDVQREMQRKLPPAASVGFPYDYQSVMHYPWLQIRDGKTNIMYPIWNDGWAMGHWQGLSSTDVQKLNLLYFKQCMERKQTEGNDTATTTNAPKITIDGLITIFDPSSNEITN